MSQPQGMKNIQLRVKTPVNGWLSIQSNNTEMYSKKISALPERRILIPMQILEKGKEIKDLKINYTLTKP